MPTPAYQVQWTAAGLAAIAAAQVGGAQILIDQVVMTETDLTDMDPLATDIPNEIGPFPVTVRELVPGYSSRFKVTTIIPAESGGYTVRGIGFRSGGQLLAQARYPATYRAAAGEGGQSNLKIEAVFIVTNAAVVFVTENDDDVFVTRTTVRDILEEELSYYRLHW